MYKVKYINLFKKNYKIIKKRGYDITLLNDIIEKLLQGKKLEAKYHDHSLKGKLKDFHECHIKPDWLLIYLIEDDTLTLTLISTGTHTDLLDM
jgi:mRNA interferase YafQ